MARGYPTPDTFALTYTCRRVFVPNNPQFIALIGGLLYEATRRGFWVQQGSMTTEQAAQLMRDALALYDAEQECDEVAVVPIGLIAWYPSPQVPSKWLRCEGQTLLQSDYPELYAALPDFQFVQVGTGLDIIILPDLAARFLYGADIDTDIGVVGGEVNHQLTIAEMPQHAHTTPNHINTIPIGDNTGTASRVARGGTTNATNINTNSSGGGSTDAKGDNGSHNNMPPYIRGYWIIHALT